MAVNKVTLNGNVLIDISDDTVASEKMVKGVTAHSASGEKIEGTLDYENFAGVSSTPVHGDSYTEVSVTPADDVLLGDGKVKFTSMIKNDAFGDANVSDVKKGKTFTSANGVKLTGTHEESSGGGGSSTGLPDVIEAGDTLIWGCFLNESTSSASTDSYSLKDAGHFTAPKSGIYRFFATGWTNSTSTSVNKARVELSSASNKQYNISSGYKAIYLPLSDNDALTTYADVELKDGERVWFFGKTGGGIVYGQTGPVGKIYAISVGINWDNGTS